MTLSKVAIAAFVAIVLFAIADERKQRRKSDEINRDLKRNEMARRNAEQDAAFRIELHRSLFFWHICRWLYGVD